MADLSRRAVIKATGAVGASILPVGLASNEATAQEPHRLPAATDVSGAQPTTYLFFNPEEAACIEAAVARLIPADDKWPGAIEAGIPNYIDKQLNGAWGAGERLYRSGPWQVGTPSQGYQLPFTPAELYRTALGAINSELKTKTPFAKMPAAEQDAYLHGLESGGKNLGGVPSNVFFATLWECTVEGFFSDPVYGGNRDMVAWRMIGFPGAYASYYDLVDQHGIKFDRPSTVYQTTHNTGGTVLGNDPKTSVVNRYLQCWDVPNVFVVGASVYPQNASYNPTNTLGALTYWALDAINNKYLKSPGPLVRRRHARDSLSRRTIRPIHLIPTADVEARNAQQQA